MGLFGSAMDCEIASVSCDKLMWVMYYEKVIGYLVKITIKPTYISLSPLQKNWNISLFFTHLESQKIETKVLRKLYYTKWAVFGKTASGSTHLVGYLIFWQLHFPENEPNTAYIFPRFNTLFLIRTLESQPRSSSLTSEKFEIEDDYILKILLKSC
jgi:hypothetical protein